jgi:predicted nuclease of restriction endonuclease-like RecB superfamily
LSKTRNKFEKRTETRLKRAKVSYSYESEKLAYVLASHYIPDFIINTPLGKVYLECKGYLRPEDKRKLKAVKKQHPEIDLRILFYASKDEYIRWATKNGFKYAVGSIPKEWLKGL